MATILLLVLAHIRIRAIRVAEGELRLGRHHLGHLLLQVVVVLFLRRRAHGQDTPAGHLIGHERPRVADDREGPVQALGYRHEDEVLRGAVAGTSC